MQARAAHAIRRSAYPQAAAGGQNAQIRGKISGFCVTSRTAAVIHAFPAGRRPGSRPGHPLSAQGLTAQDGQGTALVTDARGMRQRPADFQLIRLYV